MEYAIGVALFALGLLISICLHEAGHLGTAKAFGMKATQYFVGFGPTVWSFRKGETEYGLKAIPLGGFVRIVGMVPSEEVPDADKHRAMLRFPVWKRTVVMGAGSAVHFVLGFAILWGVFSFVPVVDEQRIPQATPQVATVAQCTPLQWELDPATGFERPCVPGQDPASAAAEADLRPGDIVTAFNGVPVSEWEDLTARIRDAGGQRVTLTYQRDGREHTAEVTLPNAERVRADVPAGTRLDEITPADLERVGVLGISPVLPEKTYGPVDGVGQAASQTGAMFRGTVEALSRLPERVPQLWHAVFGGERHPETPMSVVGASRLGGELWQRGDIPTWLVFLAAVNFFIGLFNLLPLLPLDGGHIAVAWFDKARSWVYAVLGRPDPGRVNPEKMWPVTYAVILVMGGFFLLTLAADIINPVRLPF